MRNSTARAVSEKLFEANTKIDALTAENERLRASEEGKEVALLAAESRLATAVGLLNSTVPHLPFDVAESVYAFLASAQPAALARTEAEPKGPHVLVHKQLLSQLTARTEAEQAVLDAADKYVSEWQNQKGYLADEIKARKALIVAELALREAAK